MISRKKLEEQFTSMLTRTDTHRAYWNLCRAYFTTSKEPVKMTQGKMELKLAQLRAGDPREWISKVFSEGMIMPSELYKINIVWLRHLEEIDWE